MDATIQGINNTTKEAWRKNWQGTSIDTILEIFTYPRVKKNLAIIDRHINRDDFILEAGCGLGPFVIRFDSVGHTIAGIDYQIECIQKIKDYDKRQKVFVADVRRVPFCDNTFDVYLSFGVIEHFAEGPGEVLKEAHRVLKPGGKLILTVPYKNIFLSIKAPFIWLKRNDCMRRILGKAPAIYYYQHYFSIKELARIVTNSGFVIEEIIPIDHIFSLVEFSNLFRNKNSYDGENKAAVFLASYLEKILPWRSAGSIAIIGRTSTVADGRSAQ